VEFLLAERDAKGIVVDTLSLDRGLSADSSVHARWLGSNRWGLECAANLGELPPKGATLIVGGPKIAGASGGPSRVFALL
jgi:kynurenine formamidase